MPPAPPRRPNAGTPPHITLTDREIQILNFVVLGYTNKQIARQLGLSPHTVRDRVSALRHKLHVPNRVRLAVAAANALIVGNELLP